jgi:biofilm PGA synthesis N-glycosyltransferase PgaC
VSSPAQRSYAIVSPVRNEAQYIRETLESVVNQSEPPNVWIIADDGSTDDTASIVGEFSDRADNIRLLSILDNSSGASDDRLEWAAEARAFNTGLREVDLSAVNYIVKLDGDLRFGEDYFARLLDEFEHDQSLGIAGGHCYEIRDGRRVLEWVPESHVRGATKMYRIACFSEIGGIEPVYGWDTLDEIKAQMAGWRTRSFHLSLDHLKPTGSVGGLLRGRARMGRGAFLLGYHPVFVLVRSFRMSLARPYIVCGIAFLCGYLMALARGLPRVADGNTIKYIRQQQMRRLRNFSDMTEIRSMLGRTDK